MKRTAGKALLRVLGWHLEGAPPAEPRCVVIAAPHTSNWDLLYMLAMSYAYDIDIRWMAKHTLFRFPLGPVMRRLGAIPIERHLRKNVVDQMVARFEAADALMLTVPAEGTRRRTERWKSGFYHIALRADVPVALSFLDYATKTGGFGPTLRMTGDVRKDMDAIRAFYADKVGKIPSDFGPVRLAEEETEAAVATVG
ncbi:MAG: lysophospholipid acyltransferase family protein [Myxococcales bacterium]|nr:lysophospholipid acyltransferase family protein [Myxococcales bacterium]